MSDFKLQLQLKMVVCYCILFSVFVILLSVFCYGIIYFPIFAALTLRSAIGYAIGTLHVWVFTYKAYDDTFSCASSVGKVNIHSCKYYYQVQLHIYVQNKNKKKLTISNS